MKMATTLRLLGSTANNSRAACATTIQPIRARDRHWRVTSEQKRMPRNLERVYPMTWLAIRHVFSSTPHSKRPSNVAAENGLRKAYIQK